MGHFFKVVGWAILSVCIASCKSTIVDIAPLEVEFQGEAASTHISIDSISTWESYVEELQPAFSISEKDALKQVVPTTLRF
ncbi:hypothetical protein GCM10011369_05760 [Neiella marina]|uniref:Uncharacterized protein n=1 Tax=Neiella marina TaxID=508461 RepID=A0A8J2U2K3_9GAMM|nr:hypothetical protein GCM10011369_05760 [Neiella marina]